VLLFVLGISGWQEMHSRIKTNPCVNISPLKHLFLQGGLLWRETTTRGFGFGAKITRKALATIYQSSLTESFVTSTFNCRTIFITCYSDMKIQQSGHESGKNRQLVVTSRYSWNLSARNLLFKH